MKIADTVAQRSKDPNTQVGACVVDKQNIPLALGYNGFPRGCSDVDFPWGRNENGNPTESKYMYVVHAEANAILNKNCVSLDGATLYVTLYPCHECAKLIIQAGIKHIIYRDVRNIGDDSWVAATRMFNAAGISLQRYDTIN